ncbi:MAG: SDR family oxidoreductase, partial [Acidimicrobiia bacterium]
REHALLLAREGASVIVNDAGGGPHGEGAELAPAQEVVRDIEAAGGRAIANGDSVAVWDGARRLVDQAVEVFGGLDIVINNAGISRDRMAHKLTEDDWDSVVDVHLKGTFAVCHFAAIRWRDLAKQSGQRVDASIVNTSSASGLFGSLAQVNYVAAKAGVAALTVSLARELESTGARVNAVAPVAATRLFKLVLPDTPEMPAGQHDPLGVHQISPLVAWLCSDLSRDVSGQVFEVNGTRIRLVKGWHGVSQINADGHDWSIERIEAMRAEMLGGQDTSPGKFTIEV